MRRGLPLLSGALALAACAQQEGTGLAGTSPKACFYPSQVSGFSDAGPDRAIVRLGFRESFELTLSPGCPDVNWALRIGIRARGGERICTGRPAELLVPNASGSGFQRCLINRVRRLGADEAAAARGEQR